MHNCTIHLHNCAIFYFLSFYKAMLLSFHTALLTNNLISLATKSQLINWTSLVINWQALS